MTSKEKVRAAYPRAYINGGGERPTPWKVYASIDECSKADPLVLGRSGSPAGAWNNAARSIWVTGHISSGVKACHLPGCPHGAECVHAKPAAGVPGSA